VLTVGGSTLKCCGVGTVRLGVGNRPSINVEVLIVDGELLGLDLLLGLDAIKQLGGMSMTSTGEVTFPQLDEPSCAAIVINEPDFHAKYDANKRIWIASWKWSGDQPPVTLKNRLSEYPAPEQIREEYNRELQTWIQNGWLLPYPADELGPPKGLIPLMAVLQENKQKVRPVMDYRELNEHVDAFTASADVCAHKLRDWRQQGSDVSVLDLRRAYLQVHIEKSLWPFQTVEIKGKRYCLTRLGFGLNVAPLIMRSIVNTVVAQDERVKTATSSYIDDIFVNETICSASRVKKHLERFGLTCKAPEKLRCGTRVLGLHVWEERNKLRWCRGGEPPTPPDILTRRTIFSVCGKLTGHFPVCGWLRVATAFIKRRANAATIGWDDEVRDPLLSRMLADVFTRVAQTDPTRGDWCVDGQDVTVWVDASSLATGVVIESGGAVAEDASWLRPMSEDKHINLAELDAVLRGINLALQWKATAIHLRTDSACVHRWVSDTLSGRSRVRTKAATEMLIRRRLGTLAQLVSEYELTIDVALVKSHDNRADQLTRVPQRWLDDIQKESEPAGQACAVATEDQESDRIRAIHQSSGHPGVKRTLYFVKLVIPGASRAAVRAVVRDCKKCQSIDPAPVHWKPGRLSVCDNWSRVGMDVTHFGGQHYLTLMDCGPSRFSIWRPLQRQDSASIIRQLETIFCERGPPIELLTDNAAVFCGERFTRFAKDWGVRIRFRCAYVPSGNGIVERSHRTIKRIAARTECSIMEAVYWYNLTPKNDTTASTAPSNIIYTYRTRVKGIDTATPVDATNSGTYAAGDVVWVKRPHGRCTTQFEKRKVTKVYSPHSVLVDGVPRHVKDVRPVRGAETTSSHITTSDEETPMVYEGQMQEDMTISTGSASSVLEQNELSDTSEESTTEEIAEPAPLRRSSRIKRPAPHCPVCDPQIREECDCREQDTRHHAQKRPRFACACCGAVWKRAGPRCADANLKLCRLTNLPC